MIRTSVDKISLLGRVTQGVTVMRIGEGDKVAAIAAITLSNAAGQDRQLALSAAALALGTSGNGTSPSNGSSAELPEDDSSPDDDVEESTEGDDEDGSTVSLLPMKSPTKVAGLFLCGVIRRLLLEPCIRLVVCPSVAGPHYYNRCSAPRKGILPRRRLADPKK
ncbi:MAG: DNA gyrase C-terminal beta-propeller domain-containing protein [Dehalococcoidia bacterium]